MKAIVTALVFWCVLPTMVVARVWTDRTGEHSVEAEFVELTDGSVKLKQANGWLLTVPLDSLSVADQTFAKEQARGLPPAASTDSTTSDVQVELVALAIAKREPENESAAGTFPSPSISPFTSGTSLRFRLSTSRYTFVGFDEDASKVISCSDDQGTDLLKNRGGSFNGFMFNPLRAKVVNDGRVSYVDLQVESTPAAGATKLVAKAQVVMLAGADEKTAEQKDLTLTPGTEITTGPIAMSIDTDPYANPDHPEPHGEGIPAGLGVDAFATKRYVVITSKASMIAIKKLEFFTPAGTPIKHVVQMSSTSGTGKQATQSQRYALAENLKSVTLKVTYYGRLDPVNVPIDISTGVGF